MTASSKPPFAGEVRRVRLGDVCEVERASGPSDDEVWLLNLEVVEKDTGCVARRETVPRSSLGSSTVSFTADSVLYSKLRPNLNKVVLPDSDGYATSEMIPLRPNTSMLTREYLAAYLRSYGFVKYAVESTAGAKMPRVSRRTVFDAVIPLPSIEEQNAVTRRFEVVNSLVMNCHRQLSLLDDLVKSRFVELFGDPAENPMGFRRETLATLGDLKNGVNYRKGESGCTVLCLGVSDFGNRSELRGVSGLSPISLSSRPSEESFLKDGDLVFVRSNGNRKLVGRCMAVYPQGDDVIYSGFCIRFRLTSDNVRIPYLVWALKQPSMRELLLGRGANVQNLSQRALSDVMVPIPSLCMQDAFVAFAAEVAKSQVVVKKQIDKLQTLYDSLSQRYFA